MSRSANVNYIVYDDISSNISNRIIAYLKIYEVITHEENIFYHINVISSVIDNYGDMFGKVDTLYNHLICVFNLKFPNNKKKEYVETIIENRDKHNLILLWQKLKKIVRKKKLKKK